MNKSSIVATLDSALGHKSGLLLSYLGTILIASAIGFNKGIMHGEYMTVIATHPNFLQWGLILIGFGFILQFLDTASLRSRIFYILILLAPLLIKILK